MINMQSNLLLVQYGINLHLYVLKTSSPKRSITQTNLIKNIIFNLIFFKKGKRYPIYGVQWHPEKNPFEWTTAENIPHSADAILAAQFVANFFVNQGLCLDIVL